MTRHRDLVVVGASVGGVRAVCELIAGLPADFPAAVLLAIHMAPGYGTRLPEVLSGRGKLRAGLAIDGEPIVAGRVYVAPPDMHLQVRSGTLGVARGAKENNHRPSIDLMFRTAAQTYRERVIGVVLTGNMDCGTAGLLSIQARGGLTVVQDPADAEAPSMCESALRNVEVDHVVRLTGLASLLCKLVDEPLPKRPETVPDANLRELEGEELGAPAVLVCPLCQGRLTESQVGSYHSYRCHVGHAFSLASLVEEQAESTERALWAAVRALEEAADLTARLALRATSSLRARFEEKELEQRAQVDMIKRLIMNHERISAEDAPATLRSAVEE